MKKILLLFLTIICICSCENFDYSDWETQIKYDLICDSDTLHFEDIDTISYHKSFKPVAIVTPDESSIIVRFMNGDGKIPSIEWDYNYNGKIKNIITYDHSISRLNAKLEIVEFKKRLIKNKKVSRWNGHEIVPDTNMTFVPVI